ncbi:MAG: diguanylate cyclase [Candidatus Omnitrophica bacterium]|nr:diguanylate cyclase [Candidatus Omnitrophota bacterium]
MITSLYFLFVLPLDFFQVTRLGMQDLFFKYRYFTQKPIAELAKFVLISIDSESVLKLGERWPLKRETYAQIVDRLRSYNPKLIAMDFIFAGKETPAGDFLLTESLTKAGNVILAAYVNERGQLLDSKSEIRNAALSSGIASKLWDRDFTIRRMRPLYREVGKHEGGKWSWELEIMSHDKEVELDKAVVDKNEIEIVKNNRPLVEIPLVKDGTVEINYRFRLEDVGKIPLWQVMDGSAERDKIEGKVALVGTSSAALLDFYPTPLGVLPGVIVNFNYLINLYADDFCHSVPEWFDFLILWLGVFLVLVAVVKLDLMKGFLLVLTWIASFLGVSWLLVQRSYIWDFLSPLLVVLFLYLAISLVRYAYLFVENISLKKRVIEDALTGLFTRNFMKARLEAELYKIKRLRVAKHSEECKEIAVLMVDIDHFKQINDRFGHQSGDEALRITAKTFKDCIRGHDIAARYGGEEFCALLMDVSEEEAMRIAERMRSEVESKDLSSIISGLERLTVSVGCAMVIKDALESYNKAIKAADVTLYRAKNSGRNRVCRFDPSIDLLQ